MSFIKDKNTIFAQNFYYKDKNEDNPTTAVYRQNRKVWVCRNCSAPREFDSTFRKATQELFHEEHCDGLFAQNIEKAINYDEKIEFYYKKGEVVTWQKE